MNINDIITESQHKCPHCGGPVFEYSELGEGKKDACYYKVKASAKVWPSAYASGRLVQCRKKGAGNYGNKSEGVAEGLDEAVSSNYLYHATGGLKEILQSGAINAARGPQDSTKAQTKLPTVSVTRDWGYASGSNATAQEGGISRVAVIVLDRNAVEQRYKTLGTSQSRDNRGLAFPKAGNLKAGQDARSYDTDQSGTLTKADADDVFNKGTINSFGKPASRQEVGQRLGQAKHDYYTPKAGGEFEEAVVVPKGSLPIQGTMVGFWVNPRGPLAKDPAIMNDPRRLDMPRPNQFTKATQTQGMGENFADGRNPQDKGDAKRHGINTKASVSSLRKTAKQGGRKGQLAHWLANMKAGRAKNEDLAENIKPEMLFYAKLPSGQKVYARVKDEEQLADLQQQYRGAEIKTFDYSRPDVIKWLQARGVNLSKFVPGVVKTVYDVMEAAHTANFNDDDWYEINPDTKTIVSQQGPQAYQVPFGQRQINLPNGNIVVRGMRAKGMGLDTGLDKPQQKEDGTWGAL